MVQLLIVVISIALMAALAVSTLVYVPSSALRHFQLYNDGLKGVKTLEAALVRHVQADWLSADPAQPGYVYPGDGLDLVTGLVPKHTFLPVEPLGEFAWDVSTKSCTTGVAGCQEKSMAICLYLKTATSQGLEDATVLAKVAARLPQGSTVLSDSCGATAPGSVKTHLTYWVYLSQIPTTP